MKRILTFFLFATLTFAACLAQNERLYTSDKLSSNLITCICQDKAGYIWIGTEHGLNKFDGYRFTNYLHHRNEHTSIIDNIISTLFVDKDGNLLVGTNRGLQMYDYGNDNFIQIKDDQNCNPRVSDICQTRDGTILAGTAGFGLFRVDYGRMVMKQISRMYDYSNSNFYSRIYEDRYHHLWRGGNESTVTRYSSLKNNAKVKVFNLPCGTPVTFLTGSDGNMMIVCKFGILKYEKDGDRLLAVNIDYSHIKKSNVTFKNAVIDKSGNILLGTTGNGMLILKKGSNVLESVERTNKSFDLSSAYVRTICIDRTNNTWIGFYRKGMLYLAKKKEQFSSWSFSGQNYNVGSSVSSICAGDNGSIYCTVLNNGVYKFDASGKIIAHPASPEGSSIIYRDSEGNYWIGTNDGLYSYRPQNGTWTAVAKIKCETMNYITEDGHGTLFISAYGSGLCTYNIKTKKFTSYSMFESNTRNKLNNNWIMALKYDQHGLLWIGYSTGLSVFSPANRNFHPLNKTNFLSGIICYTICNYGKDDLLIGTNEGLYIYNRKSSTTMPFKGGEQLQDKIISSIVTDNEGDIWCSTSMGIWQYQKRNKRFISYVNGNGLSAREYTPGAFLHNTDDRICFGTSDGITAFYPKMIKYNSIRIGELKLTNMIIGNKTVNCSTTSGGDIVTKSPISESNHFEISYLDNSFIMEFSLLNYSESDNIIYEYRLNGTGDWMSTEEGKNSISFNHLQPGYYTLEVRACDNGNYSTVKIIRINVTPPWYSSTTAYIIYILLVLAFGGLGAYLYNRKKHEELYEEKMQFLINATHDIRSPLTLILSPLHKLMERVSDEESKEELNVIDRNAQRILRLVNQILDIRKFDKNQMRLRCQNTDMKMFIKGVCKNFEYRAKEAGMNFSFECNDVKEICGWIDRINFEKVITNILSNSFKYTSDKGEIKLSLSRGTDDKAGKPLDKYIQIKVIDNGIGIREAKIEKIFERFYQSDNATTTGVVGTGIGLSLCKMIVELHHGCIKAENRTDTHGTCFTVRIPDGKEHLSPAELIESEVLNVSPTNIKKKKTNSRYKILVVDDDEEMGNYICSELSEFFKFGICKNGNEAMAELLNELNYDLVISDVMMPGMDGFTLVKTIKSNCKISHIPVILLTSKSDIDNRLVGIEKGADAFLAKPFNMDELHVTINTLINNMLRLKGKFSGAQQQTDKIEEKDLKSNNDVLMERIMKAINKNLSSPDFNVDKLTEDVGISRAQLHRKMKEMTGIPASEFIRNLRLDQAAKLLREHKVNVTQVAYAVGFSNQAHFSTVFHKHFGVSPSEYVERQNDVTK